MKDDLAATDAVMMTALSVIRIVLEQTGDDLDVGCRTALQKTCKMLMDQIEADKAWAKLTMGGMGCTTK